MKKLFLKRLSDLELLSQIQKLRKTERHSTLEIVLHLNEVERRRLHLKLGYGSLFEYCTKHLRYSESAAGRRIQSARCVGRHPEAYELLEKNTANLSTIALVAPILDDTNKHDVLSRIKNKSQRDVDAIASEFRPPIRMRDRVKPVHVRVPNRAVQSAGPIVACDGGPGSEGKGLNQTSGSDYSRSGSDIMLTKSVSGVSRAARTRIEKKLHVQFLASEAFMKRYDEVRALLSQRLSDTSFENVFEAVIEEFLDRHCPFRKKARRDKRAARATQHHEPVRAARGKKTTRAAQENGCGQAAQKREEKTEQGTKMLEPVESVRRPGPSRSTKPTRDPRQIPAAVRDRVFERDNGRCTYVGVTGRRCGSRQALQIDHIRPVSRGGPNTLSNLRLLCARHNRLAAQEVLGEAVMGCFWRRE